MAKFKVGDEVAIAALVKITEIQELASGKVTYATDRGFCIHEVLMDEIALKAKEQKTEGPKPAPQPAHRFKVGDRVDTGCYGLGTVIFVDVEPDAENESNYLVRGEKKWDREAWIGCVTDNKITSGKGCDWFNCYQLSPAPAPEPPKFYTGKVFAEKSSVPLFESRDGKVFEFVDGQCVNASFKDSMDGEIRNISHLREMKSCTTWHEVKSDV